MAGPMVGRVAVVTGANSGIGLETSRGLARLGATVVLACRDAARGEAARRAIAEDTASKDLEVRALDLASLASVRAFAAALARDHPRLHVLVNNAGIYRARRIATAEGFESTFAVNHLGHFLLTNLLLPQLKAGAPSRIVNVASEAQRGGRLDFEDLMGERRWSGVKAYMQSKLANVVFTYELARRLGGTGVTANAVHPGVVATGWAMQGGGAMSLGVRLWRPFSKTPVQGADTVVWLATAPDVEGVTGKYFSRRRELRSQPASYDREVQRRLWDASERLVGLAAKAST